MIKSVDLTADFLGEITTSSTAKFIAEISADKIGRVTDKIGRFYHSSVIGFTLTKEMRPILRYLQ